MHIHSKTQKQALMRLQVQRVIAVAGIKNNKKKQKALKEEKRIASCCLF